MNATAVDVLVIGLGPGGGSAARILAEKGFDVLGIEKKAEIGQPVQCAEFVPLPMGSYARTDEVRAQSIIGMKSFLPSGESKPTDFPGLMINRAKFDAAIVHRAQDAGAKIQTATRLVKLEAGSHQATVEHKGEQQIIHYKMLVAADGPHSQAARQLGLAELETVNTRQYTVPLLKPYDDTDIWLSDDYPGGYAWLFPKGNIANIGLGADKAFTADLKQPLDKLHKQLVEQGLVGEEISYRTGGLIPVGGMRDKLYIQDCVLVGDAAGLTHPITGAGISAAVISGEAAGHAVAAYMQQDEDALEDYDEDMRDQFEITLNRAVATRQWLKKIWRTKHANQDDVMRHSWIAFDEYFDNQNRLPEIDG